MTTDRHKIIDFTNPKTVPSKTDIERMRREIATEEECRKRWVSAGEIAVLAITGLCWLVLLSSWGTQVSFLASLAPALILPMAMTSHAESFSHHEDKTKSRFPTDIRSSMITVAWLMSVFLSAICINHFVAGNPAFGLVVIWFYIATFLTAYVWKWGFYSSIENAKEMLSDCDQIAAAGFFRAIAYEVPEAKGYLVAVRKQNRMPIFLELTLLLQYQEEHGGIAMADDGTPMRHVSRQGRRTRRSLAISKRNTFVRFSPEK
jgi:hypothetical protein